MVRDPWWIYAYWEIRPEIERAARLQLAPQETIGLQSVLRVYDVTDLSAEDLKNAHRVSDIPISSLATNWYIHTDAPAHAFIVEIGLRTAQGRFLPLARSNRLMCPRCAPAEIIDEGWKISDEDYWALIGESCGWGTGASPLDVQRMITQLPSSGFSPGMFSPGAFGSAKTPKAQERHFGLWVKTELILYGGTDPKAKVTIQGQPVGLRADGTFSLRMALPDGTQTIPVEGTSPDGRETRRVVTVVTQQTTMQTNLDGQPASDSSSSRRLIDANNP